MFGNFVNTIKTNSAKLSESLTSDNLKITSSKLTSALDNVKTTIKNRTSSLSSHLKNTYPNGVFARKPRWSGRQSSFDSSYDYPPNEFIDGRLEIREDYDYDSDSSVEECDNSLASRFSRATRHVKHNRRRRNEREEIRRRLASGDLEDLPPTDRPGKKPSLQSRLQSGMNLQICFMNDAMSDSESPGSDGSPQSLPTTPKGKTSHLRSLPPYTQMGVERSRTELSEANRLQSEARAALSQAQGLARMQMHQERRRLQTSPITDMLRNSLRKVGVELAEGRRRLSRQLLTDMNVAQLQVIVNDLHTQIESLNEGLVKYLMERDELHMGQDSMLVDIEDLTRYLGAKENYMKEELAHNNINQNNNNHVPPSKPVITRIVSIGKK